MGLTLRFQNSGALPGGPSSVQLVGGTLTIGRGEENDLALPDPERTLSKRHCFLEERNGEYIIVDISTNGTFLNYGSERLGDLPTPLSHGDVICLGAYELVVEIAFGAGSAAPDPIAAPLPPVDHAPVSPGQASDVRQTQDFVGSLDDPAGTGGGDFLDDLLGTPAQTNPASPKPSWEQAVVPEDPLSPSDPVPEHDDPFFHKPEPEQGLPDGTSASDHSPTTQDYFAAPMSQANLIPDDWDEDLVSDPDPDPDSEPVPEPVPPSDSAPEIARADGPFDRTPEPPLADPLASPVAAPPSEAPPVAPPPPAAAQPSHATVPPQTPAPASGAIASDQTAARTFLQAAGVGALDISDAELAETMGRLGRVFAAMVAGMREILMTRAEIKSELRMNRTMINMGGNNPLKFSISAEQALEAMIRPSVQGYLDAETATAEALNDIKAHEVAMMSGMEAALKDLLNRLGPDELSERIEAGTSLGSILGGKKARYWEAYEKMYAQIAKETEDDFQSAFGREFARAYEDQLKKL